MKMVIEKISHHRLIAVQLRVSAIDWSTALLLGHFSAYVVGVLKRSFLCEF